MRDITDICVIIKKTLGCLIGGIARKYQTKWLFGESPQIVIKYGLVSSGVDITLW